MSSDPYGYHAYAQGLRGTESDLIRRLLRRHLPRFRGCRRVLDLGCGEGHFLQLSIEAGIPCEGVDRDPRLVESGRQAGLPMVVGDAVAHLQAHQSSYDGIFCSHLIEHMPFSQVCLLIEAAAKALLPDGGLLLVFPNPESIRMQCFGFWKDPEHVRFYHADLVRSVCDHTGLRGEILTLEPEEAPLEAPHLAANHQDWAALDLAHAFERYQSILSLPSQDEPSSQPTEGGENRWLRALLYPLAKVVAKALTTCSQPGHTLAIDLREMDRRTRLAQREIQALQSLVEGLMEALGRFHEEQSRRSSEGNQRGIEGAEALNHDLGVLIRILNGTWGVSEESAVWAVKR